MKDIDVSKSDFRGYATRYGVKCGDGRTIKHGAFSNADGVKVPLVWQHGHDNPNNILWYAYLDHKDDGVYAYGFFNETESGLQAKSLLAHGDVEALSIYANKLKEKSQLVHSGYIRELSLVLSGSNPGAFVEHVTLAHGEDSEDEAIIYSGDDIDMKTTKQNTEELTHEAKDDNRTVEDVLKTFTDEQKTVLYALIAKASEGDSDDEMEQSTEEGETFMKKNVFNNEEDEGGVLTHSDLQEFSEAVFADMPKMGFKAAFLAHAGTYGINNIDFLFPDAKVLDNEPGFETRRMGWVSGWMSGTRHVPFSRIKKLWADLTPEAARAKGYITGNQKTEQVFALLKRTTEPTTVYKKQKLDRDDVSDITGFDVVVWMWRELRFMLDEEIARAGLVGDGRVFGVNDDAIDPSKIRPIYGDDPLFTYYLTLEASVTDYTDIMDAIQVARVNYKGTGTPNFYTTNAILTGMLLLRDTTNRRLFRSVAEVAAELRVADIIEVEVLEGVQRTNTSPAFTANLLGIMVNPTDYTYGADAGGQIATFDDFDIDFNQMKYLIETRLSGSLLNPKSALVVERKTA